MKSFRDLEIYNLSYQLALKAHRASLRLPRHEMYEEGGQLRRSSKAITSCIVEGYGRRRYKAEFVKFLVYSQASCDETMVHLRFIADAYPEHKEELEELVKSYEEVGKRINRFINYVERHWQDPRPTPPTSNQQLATCN